jgi:hypothetical protein
MYTVSGGLALRAGTTPSSTGPVYGRAHGNTGAPGLLRAH